MYYNNSKLNSQQTQKMRRKISIQNPKSAQYIYTNFLKQYKKALQHYSIGQILNWRNVMQTLSFMGFIEQEPTQQDIELSKTITHILSDSLPILSVKRMNLFGFLLVLCDIQEFKQSTQGHTQAHIKQGQLQSNTQGNGENSYAYEEEEVSGLVMDQDINQEPMVVIEIGWFDQGGKWKCSQIQKQQIQGIFAAMRAKRMASNQVQSRKRTNKQEEPRLSFQPKICTKSTNIFQQRLKKCTADKKQRVENRLLLSQSQFNEKIKQQLDRSIYKQLQPCTFKPQTNTHSRHTHNHSIISNNNINNNRSYSHSNSHSKQNIGLRSNSQSHLQNLLNKGVIYKQRKQKLKQLHIKLNQSIQLENCTFKPQTTKHSNTQTTKYVYVRNRDKEIQRIRQGRKQREFMNKVKDRGYPAGINWSQFITKKVINDLQPTNTSTSNIKQTPILCIDLKIMNQQHNVNVFNGDNVIKIAQRIGREHQIPEQMWWKVQQLIRKALEQCSDIRIQSNNQIVAQA